MKPYMKIIVGSLAAVAVIGAAHAASTGNITIYGTVPLACNITVTATTNATSGNPLDLSVNQTDVAVATVNEACNKNAGYTVTLASANSFKFVGQTLSSDQLSYSLKYNSVAVSGPTITNAAARTASGGVNKNLTLSLTGDASLGSQEYRDTLTFTIAAN